MNNIGNLIIEERRKQHISQDELASRLHVSRQTVSSWESGKTEPGATLMFKLCEELNINFNKFITNNDELKEYVANEKKKTKRKSIFLIIGLIIFFLVIILLLLLLIFNSNKFKVYKLSLESDNYSINNGILILSKVNNYFSLGTIKVNSENLNEDNEYYIRIYYKDNDKENLILATFYSDDIVINEEYGYNEYFDDFDTNIDNLYLDISYIIDDEINTETFKFKTEEIMENDIWLYLKHPSIGDEDDEPQIKEENSNHISIDSLVNNGYTYNGNWSYEKKIDNGGYMYSLLDNELSYYYFDDECSINIYFDLNNNELKSTDYDYNNDCFKNSFIYSYNDKELLCVEGDCNNYEDYLQTVENELEKLKM